MMAAFSAGIRNIALGLLVASAAPVFGQADRDPAPRPEPATDGVERDAVTSQRTTRTTSQTSVSKTQVNRLSVVMKSKVLIQDDVAAGNVVDFVLNEGGCIDYVVAAYDEEYYVIPYSAVNVRYADSVVFVDISRDTFRSLQFFAANNWPDLTSRTYQQKVFSSFNVNTVRQDGERTTFKRNTADDDAAAPRGNRNRDANNRDADRDRPMRDGDRGTTRDGDRGANRDNALPNPPKPTDTDKSDKSDKATDRDPPKNTPDKDTPAKQAPKAKVPVKEDRPGVTPARPEKKPISETPQPKKP